MNELDLALLNTGRGDLLANTTFNAINNAHGLFDGLRFVVRLSPRVHELVASLPDGVGFRGGVDFERIQAFSTYLHETIHWWQHIGSTCGLMLSLSYPGQTHANLQPLRAFVEKVGPVKSIRQWAATNVGSRDPDSPSGLANRIINNQFDIEAYRLLATNPERAQGLVNSGMFESVGHSYEIAIGNAVAALASTFDREFNLIPHPKEWEAKIGKLRGARETGFFHGSPIELSPIGAFHIFEGQARFSQLQYLHFASGGQFEWDDAEQGRMLDRTYMLAFETFLAVAALSQPPSIDHPVVGLFLLICDLAMNPGEAFPFTVPFAKAFIDDVDPGKRFLLLCTIVREFCPETATAIQRYSASEYAHVTATLCKKLRTFTPLQIASEVNRWVAEGKDFSDCLQRHDLGQTDGLNLPLQVLFGQFLSYQRDKARYPHILCWPGAAMAGEHASEESVGVFTRQSPLFIDRADDQMIVPVIRAGLDEADVMSTFQDFYSGYSLYDLVRQWTVEPGPFKYDFRWLQPNGTREEIKLWADRMFTSAFNVPPDEFIIHP
jgi:hypothetical protein